MKTSTTILAVGGLAAAGGVAYYVWQHRTKSSSSSSGTSPSGSSGSNSGSSGSASHSSSTTSTSSHQQVSLSAPSSASVGSAVTLSASTSTLSNPVYQFWYLPPGGNWQQDKSGYQSSSSFAFTPTTSGTYHVIAYAREANAPTQEDAAQRAQYEYYSAPHTITVS